MYIIHFRNNPFLEREVQKSSSACSLSRRDRTSADKPLQTQLTSALEGVLKSQSACALHPVQGPQVQSEPALLLCPPKETGKSEETIKYSGSTETIVPDLTLNNTCRIRNILALDEQMKEDRNKLRQISDTAMPSLTRVVTENPAGFFGRSLSAVEAPVLTEFGDSNAVVRCSERAKRIREARERFLSTPAPSRIRRTGTGSAQDLRPGDRYVQPKKVTSNNRM